MATKKRVEVKGTTKQKMARRHSKKGGNRLEQESNRQRTMEGIDGGLHPAVNGQTLGERTTTAAAGAPEIGAGAVATEATALTTTIMVMMMMMIMTLTIAKK